MYAIDVTSLRDVKQTVQQATMKYYLFRGYKDHEHISVISNRSSIHAYVGEVRGEPLPKSTPPKHTFDLLLYERSIVTDTVMHFSGNGGRDGLFVSDRFRAVLDSVRLPVHYYFQGSLRLKNAVYTNYQYLHIPVFTEYSSFIDLQRTAFYTMAAASPQPTGPYRFTTWREAIQSGVSLPDYEAFFRQNTGPLPDASSFSVYLSQEATNYDLIDLPWHTVDGYIISERLYRRLVDALITGIELVFLPWLKSA